MFRPVTAKPDFVSQEHDLLREWAARGTFARLRAQNAGNERWSFLDGPITANNPMGVHHAWGRTYKDLFQRYHAMLGQDQRFQNGFDCQGLWVEVNVERDLGFKSKRDIEAFGIAEFVSLCKQRVLTYAARQTEQIHPARLLDGLERPGELLRLRDLLAADPAQQATIEGPRGPVTDTVEMIVGRLGMPDTGGSYFTFSNENNDLIWGFLAECHRRGWIYKGHDSMPWCPRCGTGLSPDGDERGLRGPRGPRADRALPARRPAGRGAARLDDDAVDAGRERRRGRRRRSSPTCGSARARTCCGWARACSSGPWSARSRCSRSGRARTSSAGATRGPFDELPAVGKAFAGAGDGGADYEHRVVAWDEVGEEEGTGIVHIAPGCGAEDFQLGKALGLPVIGPIDEDGLYYDGFGWLSRPRGAGGRRVGRLGPRAARLLLPPRGVFAPLPALLAMRHAAAVPPRGRVVHQHGPGLRQAARAADGGRGRRQPALPDHGGRRPDPVDPVVRLRARARLAAATCATG